MMLNLFYEMENLALVSIVDPTNGGVQQPCKCT